MARYKKKGILTLCFFICVGIEIRRSYAGEQFISITMLSLAETPCVVARGKEIYLL